jgi:gas vesicle protein GvpL/GvpF
MPEPAQRTSEHGFYVYGVVPVGEEARPRLRGIDEAEVEFVEHASVAAAVTEIALDRPPGRRAELVAHTRVVDALSALGPVLPVQFGSIIESADAIVEELLGPEHDRFVELLDNLVGRHQLNLRADYVEEQILGEIVQNHPDIAELRRRTRQLPEGTLHPDLVRLGELVSLAVDSIRDQDAEAIMERVRPLVLDESSRGATGMNRVLDVALLVEDDGVPRLEDALETLAEAMHERIRLRLTGPLAPYDFAEARAWA